MALLPQPPEILVAFSRERNGHRDVSSGSEAAALGTGSFGNLNIMRFGQRHQMPDRFTR